MNVANLSFLDQGLGRTGSFLHSVPLATNELTNVLFWAWGWSFEMGIFEIGPASSRFCFDGEGLEAVKRLVNEIEAKLLGPPCPHHGRQLPKHAAS